MIKLILSFILIGIISFLSVLFYLNFRDKSFTTLQKTYSFSTFLTYKSGELMKGDIVTGQFRAVENNLGIVAIRFQTFDRINSDLVVFRMKEQGSDQWYYVNEYQSRQFGGYPLFPFGFPIIADSKGKDYHFELESLYGKPGNAIGIDTTEPVLIAKHKFAKNQLISDKKVFLLFAFQKIRDVLDNKKAFRDLVSIYIILISLFAVFGYRERILRYSATLLVQLRKKGVVIEKWFSERGKALRFIIQIVTFTGKTTLKILSLFPKWLGKE